MWEADDSQDLWSTPGNSPAASMAHGERMVGSELTPEDLDVDRTLRPQRLDDYCGQEHIKQSLRVLIEAAQSRGETLDHVIFSGPPGLGKTTLATVIANELGAQIKTTSGPAIARTGDLAAILTNLQPGDVLFIDEIHRLNRSVEEVLYPAMEDFALDIVIGKGPAARSIRLDIPKFTLVAATTRSGMLTGPLRDRFGISYRLDYYTVEELAQIVTRSATILGVTIDHPSALEIGSRSRGTPRLANRLLKRVRDYAQVRGNGPIELDICRQALEFFEIDELGLDWMDIRILETLAKTFSGRAVGLTTLASAVGEDPGTLEDVYEPYLLQCGLMIRTPRLANRLLKRVRDYAQVRGNGPIELDICRQALEFFEIDELGLDWMDIRILETLAKTFSGRAVGLTTLASAVGEDPGTLEDVYEPYLLQCGLMIRTPQGRQATLRTFEHLGIEPTL